MFVLHELLLCVGECWSGTIVRVYCDQELRRRIENTDPEENAILVMNDHNELDGMHCRMIGDRVGIVGTCRTVIKDSLKYLKQDQF